MSLACLNMSGPVNHKKEDGILIARLFNVNSVIEICRLLNLGKICRAVRKEDFYPNCILDKS